VAAAWGNVSGEEAQFDQLGDQRFTARPPGAVD